eukprot:scaffold13109_cov25-Tisochrysis_lutea.AAC.3
MALASMGTRTHMHAQLCQQTVHIKGCTIRAGCTEAALKGSHARLSNRLSTAGKVGRACLSCTALRQHSRAATLAFATCDGEQSDEAPNLLGVGRHAQTKKLRACRRDGAQSDEAPRMLGGVHVCCATTCMSAVQPHA